MLTTSVYHHIPLHYLPAIAADKKLLSKAELRIAGYSDSHFRSTSRRQDIERGFGDRIHLTLSSEPRLLIAKLKRGFPHATLIVPSRVFESTDFDLCRYNIARTRLVRRGRSEGAAESPTNGRYYDEFQVPVARSQDDKQAMLTKHAAPGDMIEVLVRGELHLPDDIVVRTYDRRDLDLARDVLSSLGSPWCLELVSKSLYGRSDKHAESVSSYIKRFPPQRGEVISELEFDVLGE